MFDRTAGAFAALLCRNVAAASIAGGSPYAHAPSSAVLSASAAPAQVPKAVAPISEAPPLPDIALNTSPAVPGAVPGGQPGGLIGGIPNSLPGPPPPAAAPEPATPAVTPRLKVGGNVEAARLVHEVTPEYPRVAKMGRVSGTVRMNAIIAKDGKVEHLTVISGHPLLVQSAMDAVKQWVYKPTYLNGAPAEVETEIDVNFTLAG
jgi:protein TonB